MGGKDIDHPCLVQYVCMYKCTVDLIYCLGKDLRKSRSVALGVSIILKREKPEDLLIEITTCKRPMWIAEEYLQLLKLAD